MTQYLWQEGSYKKYDITEVLEYSYKI